MLNANISPGPGVPNDRHEKVMRSVLVLGAGSAGLLAAVSIRRALPEVVVRVVRSPEIGVIGVGEGTTPTLPAQLFNNLGIGRRRFYELAEPTWKLGIKFFWGPRDHFNYSFSQGLDAHWSDLARPNGYYCDEVFDYSNYATAFMEEGKVFPRQKSGGAPAIQEWHAFHIENRKFVATLEIIARERGIEFIDGRVSDAERGPSGIAAVLLEDGRRLAADLFIDSSGFRSELLGRALSEPFVSYDRSLFCDRSVVGGWERSDEPILPYTTIETMEAGWAWQIEHEHFVNRGYVFSSQTLSDDQAADEFLRKNPRIKAAPRVVKFRSGRYRRMWVDNVVGIGNAGGFVEPMEATALMVTCLQCQKLVSILTSFGLQPSASVKELFNRKMARQWDDVRDFLALHYYLNTRLDNPFWRHCREDTDMSGLAELLEFYAENGPTGFGRYLLHDDENPWGIEGYLVMFVGNRAPYSQRHCATTAEIQAWKSHRARFAAEARAAMGVREALACLRHPNWRWHEELQTVPGIQGSPGMDHGALAGVVRT
jgi:tryptophan halogenase